MTLAPIETAGSDRQDVDQEPKSYLSVVDDSLEDLAESEEEIKSCEAYSDAILLGMLEESR